MSDIESNAYYSEEVKDMIDSGFTFDEIAEILLSENEVNQKEKPCIK